MDCTYIYGIVEGTDTEMPHITGVDGASQVRILAGDGLACVVSDYHGAQLSTLSRAELVKSLFAHQKIVESVMQRHTVLPVKFGAILDSVEEASALLYQGRPKFAEALASIRDKVEVEIAATWNTSRVLEDISGEEAIADMRDGIAKRGQPTLEERVKLGELVKASMDRRRNHYRERMMGALEPLAADVHLNALISDEMVMNVAFLFESERQQEVDESVRRLDEQFKSKINFRVIGPLPPYSFNTVEITRLDSRKIQQARRTFGLSEEISEAEVRRAYRRVAAEAQRSPGQNNGSDLSYANELKQVADLLLSYCQAMESAPQQKSVSGEQPPYQEFLFDISIGRTRARDIEHTGFDRPIV